MEWQVVLVLIFIVPVILFPVAFVWYINLGGIFHAIKEARKAWYNRGAGGVRQ